MYRVKVDLTGFTGAPGLAVHYLDSAGGTAQQAATAVGVLWAGLDSFLADAVSWEVQAEVMELVAATGALDQVHTVTGPTGGGTNTTEPLPPSQMGLIRWRTAGVVNNRVVRGRTFVGPTTQDANDSGILTVSARADLAAAATAYLAAANATPVVWHRNTPDLADGEFHEITASDIWTQFAVLRGRRD